MSIISEIIALVGQDNFQAIVGVLVATLLGKSSWDMYTSKATAKKVDVDTFKKEVQEQIEELKGLKLELISKKMEDIEEKFKIHEERTNDLTTKVSTVLDKVIDRPRATREEAKKLKEEIKRR
jgi:hypothetical protein